MDPCKYEEDIGYIKSTLASLDRRVNGSMDSIKEHIKQGDGWRKAIAGIILAGIIQVVSCAFLFGTMFSEIQHNKSVVEKYIDQQVKGGSGGKESRSER